MNSLLPISASPFERNAAQACAGIDDIPVPLRDLWNPDTCPVRLLPYLAWARSVDRWDESWSEATKRAVVRDSFFVHQRKGTVAAVRRAIENIGYIVSLIEWWQINEPAGTFRITIDVMDIGITSEGVNELQRLIDDTKPVSRHATGVNILTKASGKTFIGVTVYLGEILTVYPEGYRHNAAITFNGEETYNGQHQFIGENNEQFN